MKPMKGIFTVYLALDNNFDILKFKFKFKDAEEAYENLRWRDQRARHEKEAGVGIMPGTCLLLPAPTSPRANSHYTFGFVSCVTHYFPVDQFVFLDCEGAWPELACRW